MKPLYFVTAAVAIAAALGACSSGDGDVLDSTTYKAGNSTSGNNSAAGSAKNSGAASAAGAGAGTGAGTGSGDGTGSGTGTGGTTTTIDQDAGAGASAAKAYFVANVYPEQVKTCSICHAPPGVAGAPPYVSATSAMDTYTTMEARGYIAPPNVSILVKKGSHEGPALTAAQFALVTQWLTLEAAERGDNAPVNLLAKLGDCLDAKLFAAINLQNLKTTKRTNENANNCTGCNQAVCQTCHQQGEYAMHSNFSQLGTKTFDALAKNATSPDGILLISKYVTTNGATLIPSTAIADKGTVTQAGTAYSHPMFTVPDTMTTAITAFAQDAIDKYNAKTCGQ